MGTVLLLFFLFFKGNFSSHNLLRGMFYNIYRHLCGICSIISLGIHAICSIISIGIRAICSIISIGIRAICSIISIGIRALC